MGLMHELHALGVEVVDIDQFEVLVCHRSDLVKCRSIQQAHKTDKHVLKLRNFVSLLRIRVTKGDQAAREQSGL